MKTQYKTNDVSSIEADIYNSLINDFYDGKLKVSEKIELLKFISVSDEKLFINSFMKDLISILNESITVKNSQLSLNDNFFCSITDIFEQIIPKNDKDD